MTAAEVRSIGESEKTRKSYEWREVNEWILKNASKMEIWLNQSGVPENVVKELRKDGYTVTYERGGVLIKW